uniref:Uncharacterized protein n=1 Tax=Heliothis virescens TaxID=7102 RepID=A0A2A4JER8_HELVI
MEEILRRLRVLVLQPAPCVCGDASYRNKQRRRQPWRCCTIAHDTADNGAWGAPTPLRELVANTPPPTLHRIEEKQISFQRIGHVTILQNEISCWIEIARKKVTAAVSCL